MYRNDPARTQIYYTCTVERKSSPDAQPSWKTIPYPLSLVAALGDRSRVIAQEH